MPSFFKSARIKNEVINLYHEKLDELSLPCEFLNVETSFGKTHIIRTGNPEKQPLVLLHGSNGCAPVALEAMIGLTEDFCIHAVDVIGQPNLSAEIRPNMNDDSYGQWLVEVITRLNIKDAVLVGISFGGLVSWKTLAFDGKYISKAFLIVPAGIVSGHPLTVLQNVFIPMKLYQWRKKEKYILRIVNTLFSEPDEFAHKFLSILFMHYKMDFTPIPEIKKAEAQKIDTPVYLVAAEDDVMFPGKKMLARAKEVFPNMPDCLLLERSKHVPSISDNERIADFIKRHT